MSIPSITDIRQYLTFQLGGEIFGIDVYHVREILEFTSVTKVPKTPDFMRGVINLRGSVVPVLDMRLKFGLTETEKTVNTCIIVVEDTGIGISSEDQGRLFQDFVRIRTSETKNISGSGLGLSIAKKMIDLYGGSVQVESTPGKGSRFTVSIPL